MNKKVIFGIGAAVLTAAVVYGLYRFTTGKWTKEKAVIFIKGKGYHTDPSSFDGDYLIAWAKAGNKGEATFTYGGKTFKVAGGKSI